jgi:hypothetical protein
LSRVLRERGKLAEAGELAYAYAHSIQCARGTNHPDRVVALTNQGDVFRARGDLAQAEQSYRQAAAEANRILGPNHHSTRAAVDEHARVLRDLGRRPETP